MSGAKILIAEDEARMRKLVCDFLRREGYVMFEAGDGQEAMDILSQNPDIDLVILDVMMPRLDGFTVCRKIREKSAIPIIILTARTDEHDEVLGFNLGADEYIAKPFKPMVLVARVGALLRRSTAKSREPLVLGGLVFDEDGRVVTIDGKRADLSPKEFELLAYLIANRGIALSRNKILDSVWDYDYYGDARTVDTHIKKLRSKLGKYGAYIQTIWSMGYKFEVADE